MQKNFHLNYHCKFTSKLYLNEYTQRVSKCFVFTPFKNVVSKRNSKTYFSRLRNTSVNKNLGTRTAPVCKKTVRCIQSVFLFPSKSFLVQKINKDKKCHLQWLLRFLYWFLYVSTLENASKILWSKPNSK